MSSPETLVAVIRLADKLQADGVLAVGGPLRGSPAGCVRGLREVTWAGKLQGDGVLSTSVYGTCTCHPHATAGRVPRTPPLRRAQPAAPQRQQHWHRDHPRAHLLTLGLAHCVCPVRPFTRPAGLPARVPAVHEGKCAV